jgi:hypothetical protein
MARTFNTKKFIKSIFNGKYALVIGNENILSKDIEKTGDVHQYFLRKVNSHCNSQYNDYWDIALEKTEKINPFIQVSWYFVPSKVPFKLVGTNPTGYCSAIASVSALSSS